MPISKPTTLLELCALSQARLGKLFKAIEKMIKENVKESALETKIEEKLLITEERKLESLIVEIVPGLVASEKEKLVSSLSTGSEERKVEIAPVQSTTTSSSQNNKLPIANQTLSKKDKLTLKQNKKLKKNSQNRTQIESVPIPVKVSSLESVPLVERKEEMVQEPIIENTTPVIEEKQESIVPVSLSNTQEIEKALEDEWSIMHNKLIEQLDIIRKKTLNDMEQIINEQFEKIKKNINQLANKEIKSPIY